MRGAVIDAERRPVHPNDDPAVQAARAGLEAAQHAADAALRAHEANHIMLHTSGDDVERWRAQAAASRLLTEMLETKAAAQDATRRYEALVAEAMIPVRAYWHRRQQGAVRQLIEILRGDVADRNNEVLAIIQEAAQEGVQLNPETTMAELAQPHLDFLCSKLRENAGII